MSLILKTLGGEPLKTAQNARQRGEELKGLAKGRQVQATVLGPDAKGNIRVRIMGGTVLAESQVPLKQGQTLNLTVEETEPELVFSMADKSNSPQVSRLNLALQEALQNRERLVQGLNNLLHAKETGDAQNARAGEITEKLRQAIRNGALNAKRAGDPEALSRLLRQSGLDLEARLARAARQPGRESRVLANPFPAGTLRGLAKALLRQLGAGMADGADLDSMAQKALQDLRGSAQGLSAALDAATRLNAELLPQKDMLYLPLPMLFGDQVLGGELLLQLPAQDENQERQGQTKLVFFLNMSALGPVAVEAVLHKDRLNGSIVLTDEPKAEFVKQQLPELIDSLRQSGFEAGFTVRSRASGEAWDASPLADLIRGSGQSFSITV